MKLRVYRTLWGVLQETDGDKAGSPVPGLEEAIAEIARIGYDGVEVPLKCILHLGKDRSGNVIKQESALIPTNLSDSSHCCPSTS